MSADTRNAEAGADISAAPAMTQQEFIDFLKHMGWYVPQHLRTKGSGMEKAAIALGKSKRTVENYRQGRTIPPEVARICRAMMAATPKYVEPPVQLTPQQVIKRRMALLAQKMPSKISRCGCGRHYNNYNQTVFSCDTCRWS